MSLLSFPPPSVQECSYALQEFNGQIISGTRKQFDTLQNSKFVDNYPRLLPEPIDDDHRSSVCCRRTTGIQSRRTWLRIVAVDAEGGRVAVCQSTDYIRIYGIGADAQQPPLTLQHAQMKNVAAMQFDPHDARLLAVTAGANVLVWRLSGRIVGTKPSGQCIRVVETGVSPLSSLVWDSASNNSLMAASCSSNKIIRINLSTGTHSSVGAWFGGGVTALYPSRHGRRLAVTFTTRKLSVYDSETGKQWYWKVTGRVTSAAWSPNGESLIFSCSMCEMIFTIFLRDAEGEATTRVWSLVCSTFDCSVVKFERSIKPKTAYQSSLRKVVTIGGIVRELACSADGERLAVTFANHECAGFIATFIVDWASLPVKLYPTGFVEAAFSGSPECVFFLPQYSAGSMLAIAWSAGFVQYVPLVYREGQGGALLVPVEIGVFEGMAARRFDHGDTYHEKQTIFCSKIINVSLTLIALGLFVGGIIALFLMNEKDKLMYGIGLVVFSLPLTVASIWASQIAACCASSTPRSRPPIQSNEALMEEGMFTRDLPNHDARPARAAGDAIEMGPLRHKVESHKITEYFQPRRSERKTGKQIEEETTVKMEEAITSGSCEDDLIVYTDESKGRGVRAGRTYEKNELVVEYKGDMIDYEAVKLCEEEYGRDHSIGSNMYFFKYKNKHWCVDATKESLYKGRLVNHSALRPNCKTKVVEVNGVHHLILIAKRSIDVDEELLCDYGIDELSEESDAETVMERDDEETCERAIKQDEEVEGEGEEHESESVPSPEALAAVAGSPPAKKETDADSDTVVTCL